MSDAKNENKNENENENKEVASQEEKEVEKVQAVVVDTEEEDAPAGLEGWVLKNKAMITYVVVGVAVLFALIGFYKWSEKKNAENKLTKFNTITRPGDVFEMLKETSEDAMSMRSIFVRKLKAQKKEFLGTSFEKEYLFLYAGGLMSENKWKQAAGIYREFITSHPENNLTGIAMLNEAICTVNEKDYSGALKLKVLADPEKAIKKNKGLLPFKGKLYLLKGLSLLEKGETGKAATALGKAKDVLLISDGEKKKAIEEQEAKMEKMRNDYKKKEKYEGKNVLLKQEARMQMGSQFGDLSRYPPGIVEMILDPKLKELEKIFADDLGYLLSAKKESFRTALENKVNLGKDVEFLKDNLDIVDYYLSQTEIQAEAKTEVKTTEEKKD